MVARVTYVLPFRRADDSDLQSLSEYLRDLGEWVDELIVADGSEPDDFEEHHRRWSKLCLHVPPRDDLSFANGKVDGVTTGIEMAQNEKVIVADDDVRYDLSAILRMETFLDRSELVRPQNFFDPAPWHALWDTGRTLLNRSFSVDYPGTLGVRRSAFLRSGGYDGDVMFENLELIRTIEESGGRSLSPLDLFVRREPPSVSRFWSQRLRQAFDDLAQPWRLMFFLTLLPLSVNEVRSGRRRGVASAALLVMGLAERGRRRAGGADVFPAAATLMAPLWVAERSICVWGALFLRLRGGVPYRDGRIKVAANSRSKIRSRLRKSGVHSRP